MKTKKLLILILTTMLFFGVIVPNTAFADKGSNDFTASLSVSETLVSAGTTVTCSITVKNTDPTYGADVAVSTSGGTLVSNFYLGAGQSKTVKHNVVINKTTNIYYTVHASHGPDISKTKNTNTVTVNVQQQGTETPEPTPNDEIITDGPDIEVEPINGVPKSGSLFVVTIENVVYDRIPIAGDGSEVISSFDDPVIMTGEIHYHLPDSIAATYHERTEDEYCYILANWRMGDMSAGGMDEIDEQYILTNDDGIIEFEQELIFNDVPILHDEMSDTLVLVVDMIDPTDGNRSHTYVWVNVTNGPSPEDGYTIYSDETYFNDELINPDEVIEVYYGSSFTISQNINYTLPEGELTLPDRHRAYVLSECTINGDTMGLVRAPAVDIMPTETEGEFVFEVSADLTSYGEGNLDYGYHTIEILAYYQRRTLPDITSRTSITLTINVVPLGPVEWGEHIDDDEEGLQLFDGVFMMDLSDWLGFVTSSIDLIPDEMEVTLSEPGEYELSGRIPFSGPGNCTIRVSGNEAFGDELSIVRAEREGESRFWQPVYVEETTEYEITAEIIREDGRVLASDTEIVTIYVDRGDPNYRQRFWLGAIPQVIGGREDATFYYSLSNELTGEAVHVRLVDDTDGSIIFEDENFEHFEMYEGSFTRRPTVTTIFSFTAQVLADEGTILWEQTMRPLVTVVRNAVPDDDEESVFNLRLGVSSERITQGESVEIFGAVDYGSADAYDAAGEIGISVSDQLGHVLGFDTSVMPRDTFTFTEEYVLYETTTFNITAEGLTVAGDISYEDTDTVTITVLSRETGEVVDETTPIYDMNFRAYTSERLIERGGTVEVLGRIVNMGREGIDAVVSEDDGSYFGGVVEYLMPGEAMAAYEAMTFTETTTFELQPLAWNRGDLVLAPEPKSITVVVVDTLPEAPPVDIEGGGYDISLFARAIDTSIVRGETTDVHISVMNTGTETADIVVSDLAGTISFTFLDVLAGDRCEETLTWAPDTTSALTMQAIAYDAAGSSRASDIYSTTVAVVDPPLEDRVYSLDLEVEAHSSSIVLGDLVDIDVSVTNTSDFEIDRFVITESETSSFVEGIDIMPGETRDLPILDWAFGSTTTVVFEVRAYTDAGDYLTMDSETITIEVTVPGGAEIPPEPVIPGDLPPEDTMPDSEESEDMFDEDASPAADAPDEDIDSSMSGVFAGGMSISIKENTIPQKGDEGGILIIKSEEEPSENVQQVYRIRRILAVLIAIILVLVVTILVLVIVRIFNKGKNR